MKLYPRLVLDIGWQDLLAGLIALPKLPPSTESISKIKAFWPTHRSVVVHLCVRTALDSLLQTLQLPPGSEIIVSAINIQHMIEIIQRHHCIPVPVDIDPATLAPDLAQFQAAVTPQTKVALIAHLYGAIVPLAAYAEICQAHHLLLVEDCAQAFAGKQYLGHPQADVSLFSFGPIKSCTALGGGVSLVKDPELAEQIQALEQTYPCKSNGWFAKRLLKYLGLVFLSEPSRLGLLVAGLRFFRSDPDQLINSLTRGFVAGDILAQLRYQPPSALLNLLRRRLEQITDAPFEQRAKVAEAFLAELDNSAQPGYQAAQHSYWLVPVVTEQPLPLIAKLQAAGFDATRGATSLRAIGETTIKAQQLLNQVVYLPVSASLPAEAAQQLASLVNDQKEKPEPNA